MISADHYGAVAPLPRNAARIIQFVRRWSTSLFFAAIPFLPPSQLLYSRYANLSPPSSLSGEGFLRYSWTESILCCYRTYFISWEGHYHVWIYQASVYAHRVASRHRHHRDSRGD